MSQSFETFVPTLKHQKLLATAEAIALENDKVEDAKTLKQATEAAVLILRNIVIGGLMMGK